MVHFFLVGSDWIRVLCFGFWSFGFFWVVVVVVVVVCVCVCVCVCVFFVYCDVVILTDDGLIDNGGNIDLVGAVRCGFGQGFAQQLSGF